MYPTGVQASAPTHFTSLWLWGVLIPQWWKKQYRFSSLLNRNPRIGFRQIPKFPNTNRETGSERRLREHQSTVISGSNSSIDSASEDAETFGQNQGVLLWWALYDASVWVWITAARWGQQGGGGGGAMRPLLTTWLLGWLEVMLILYRNTQKSLNICVLASRERESQVH